MTGLEYHQTTARAMHDAARLRHPPPKGPDTFWEAMGRLRNAFMGIAGSANDFARSLSVLLGGRDQ